MAVNFAKLPALPRLFSVTPTASASFWREPLGTG
jgi:hypothetical protein